MGAFTFAMSLADSGWWPAIELPTEVQSSQWTVSTDPSNFQVFHDDGGYAANVIFRNISSANYYVGFTGDMGLVNRGTGIFSQMYDKKI